MTEQMSGQTKAPAANDPQFQAYMIERLEGIQRAITGLTAELHGIMLLLEPCYGDLDGDPCVLGFHRGPHQTGDGTEWLDKE